MSKFTLSRAGGFTTFSHPHHRNFYIHDSELVELSIAVGVALGKSLHSDFFDLDSLDSEQEPHNEIHGQ